MKFSKTIAAITALFAAMLPVCALAETITYVGTMSVRNCHDYDITNAVNWSSGEMPNAANDYVVSGSDSANRFCAVGVNGSFPGNSLKLRGLDNYAQLGLMQSCTYSFPNDGLILDAGYVWVHIGVAFTIGGRVTVGNYGGQWGGVNLWGYNTAKSLTFTGPFTSASNSKLNVKKWSEDTSDPNKFTVYFKGDMSGYVGEMFVGGTTKNWARVFFGATSVNGTVKVNPTGVLGPCAEGLGLGECAVKDLVLTAGSTLKLGVSASTGGTVRVTNSLTMPASGKVKLDMSDYPSSLYYTGMTHPLLIAPLGTGLDSDAFELTLPSGFPALFKTASCTLTVETTEDAEILTWKTRKRYIMTAGDAWNQSAFLPTYASHWEGHSNGDPLDPEGFYYVNRDGIALASPTDNSATVAHFGGYSLLIAEQSQPFRLFQSAKIDRFYLRSNAKFSVYFGHSWRPMPISLLQGTLTLIAPDTPNYALFYGGDKNSLNIQSEIRGSNGLSLSTHSNSDAYPGNGSPTFILSGTNTSFSGKIRVSNATPPTYMTTLKVADGRNLGGAMAAFTYDGIELKAGSRLTATASLELAEPTRGLFVNGSGRIRVLNAADAITARSQLTMAGTLVKEGPGLLALGGTACRFTAAQDATPIAGTNVLEVADGRIKALSKDAFNGLAIAFASGTGLEVPMPSEVDADTQLYGLCDTSWATPFDLTGCDGKLDVSVRDIAAVPDKVDLAICTVTSAAAANLRGNIVFPRIPQHTVTIWERDNGDGTVTFLAKVQNAIHTMVIVR